MSNSDRYQAYAAAFELTFEDDDWLRLEAFFTEDAVYRPGGGRPQISGRAQILEHLQRDLDEFDRRFDRRELRFPGVPLEQGDRVAVSWEVRYAKLGLPELVIRGSETAEFRDGRICLLVGELELDQAAAFDRWMTEHGPALG